MVFHHWTFFPKQKKATEYRNMQQGGRAMKRLILVCVMILCLLPVSGWTEEAASALYPIREKGLWGYMNR